MVKRTCEMAEVNRDTGDMRQCGKPAKYSAFDPPMAFCEECCHLAMEDASLEEQATLKPLELGIDFAKEQGKSVEFRKLPNYP